MKRLLLVLFLFASNQLFSQKEYTIHGESIPLYTEVTGKLSLLWNSINGEYRYFLQSGNNLIELKNTKSENKYQGEYKQTLQEFTGVEATNIKFTKPDLANFIDTYNEQNDPNYVSTKSPIRLKARLGGFAGITNYPYFVNPDNTLLPQIGAELELMDPVKLRRYGIVLQLRQLFGSSDFDFNATQLSLNSRFKFIASNKIDIYANVKIAGYYYVSQDITLIEPNGELNNISDSSGEFLAPFGLGLGADIPLGNGFLTIQYQDIVALNLEDNGEFSTDFALGYKFNL